MTMQSKAWNDVNVNQISKSLFKNKVLVTSVPNRTNKIKKSELQDLLTSKTFNSVLNLGDQDSDDDLTTPWICWSCSRVFQFKCLLFKHQVHCNASYKRKKTVQRQRHKKLLKQILSSKKHESTTCLLCRKRFSSKLKYKLHRQQGPCSKKRLSCIECHQKFNSFRDLRSHDCYTNENLSTLPSSCVKCESSKVFTCKCCESTFDAPESLKTHLLQNSGCAKVHHLYIKIEYKKRQLNLKPSLTARKSFSNLELKVNEEKKLLPTANVKNISLNSPPRVSGSARKSFPNSSHKEQESNFCKICGKRFLSLSDLKLHEESHLQNKSRHTFSQCLECQEMFSTSHELIQHQADFDHYSQGPKPFTISCKCPFCEKQFLHVQNRNAHLRYHTEKTSSEIKEYVRKITCGVCFRTFGNEAIKEEHIQSAHIRMPITTPLTTNFESPSSLLLSDNVERKDNSPKLVVLSSITDVVLKQLRDVPNVCPVCCRTYDSNAIRNRHFRLHVMGASCECEICFLKFPLTSYLETHMKKEHKNSVKYDCKRCGISFLSRISILQHVMKNHPLYPMTDLIEENVNGKTANLDYLQLKSDGKLEDDNPKGEFQCTFCNLRFLKLCGLRRHESSKVHLRVVEIHQARQQKIKNLQLQYPPRAVTPPNIDYSKPITCIECSKEFLSVQTFVPHRLSHFSGENEIILTDETYPYTCEICGKLLDSQQKIQVHLVWHLQDVQVQASNKTFKARKSLPSSKISNSPISTDNSKEAIAKKSFKSSAKHELSSAKTLPFVCKDCPSKFATKHDYIRHMTKTHTVVQNVSEESSGSESFIVRCTNCNKSFDNKKLFNSHQKSCNRKLESSKAYCTSCGCFFSTSALFDDHEVLFCKPGFKAHIDENFINKNLDILTSAIKTDVTIISCIQCCAMFSSIEMLGNHMEKHKVEVTVNGSVSQSMESSNDSDSDYISSSCKEVKFHQSEKLSKTTDGEDPQLCKISNVNTIDPNLFDMVNSHDSFNLPSDDDDDENDLDQDTNINQNLFEMTKLRQNFSHLLSALVSDADLMQSLGFGERLIDDVLVSVLEKMALTPVDDNDDSLSDLDKLRCNIRTLLDVCIKDQIMEFITDNEITTDKIVIAALKMFGVEPE